MQKGFTLLELLVVVLIIGILAAIALPQYQIVVGKAKFSTLKSITRNVQDAAQRHYLIHNDYTAVSENINNLDIEIPKGVTCYIWQGNSNQIRCAKNIFGVKMAYYVNKDSGLPKYCYAESIDVNDIPNKICKQETGRNPILHEEEGYCMYYY